MGGSVHTCDCRVFRIVQQVRLYIPIRIPSTIKPCAHMGLSSVNTFNTYERYIQYEREGHVQRTTQDCCMIAEVFL